MLEIKFYNMLGNIAFFLLENNISQHAYKQWWLNTWILFSRNLELSFNVLISKYFEKKIWIFDNSMWKHSFIFSVFPVEKKRQIITNAIFLQVL